MCIRDRNAKLFAERRRSDEDVSSLRQALAKLAAHVPEVGTGDRKSDILLAVANAICDSLGAISCVASVAGESAGAFGAGQAVARQEPRDSERGTTASLVVARDPSKRTDLTLAVTLDEPPGEGQVELLDLIAAAAAALSVR